jgi:hypothetical protein
MAMCCFSVITTNKFIVIVVIFSYHSLCGARVTNVDQTWWLNDQ